MLIASKSGNITAATLISEGDQEWCLLVEKREVRISKSDARQRVFEKMSDALTWVGAEQDRPFCRARRSVRGQNIGWIGS
jgi:hypothetical protein